MAVVAGNPRLAAALLPGWKIVYKSMIGIKKMKKNVVEVIDLVKTYQIGEIQVNALRGLSMS